MLVTVARYSLPSEAQIYRGRLEAEGIPAFIADDHIVNMQWLYSDAIGGVRVQVPAPYEERARIALGVKWEKCLGEDEVEYCEQCGSSDIELYQIGKRAAFIMVLGFKIPWFPVRNGFKCNNCGFRYRT